MFHSLILRIGSQRQSKRQKGYPNILRPMSQAPLSIVAWIRYQKRQNKQPLENFLLKTAEKVLFLTRIKNHSLAHKGNTKGYCNYPDYRNMQMTFFSDSLSYKHKCKLNKWWVSPALFAILPPFAQSADWWSKWLWPMKWFFRLRKNNVYNTLKNKESSI